MTGGAFLDDADVFQSSSCRDHHRRIGRIVGPIYQTLPAHERQKDGAGPLAGLPYFHKHYL